MPLYEFRCAACAATVELLLARGDTGQRPCPQCSDGVMRHRFSRVAVKYQTWGFTSTDSLVAERPGGRSDFRALRDKAEQISDE